MTEPTLPVPTVRRLRRPWAAALTPATVVCLVVWMVGIATAQDQQRASRGSVVSTRPQALATAPAPLVPYEKFVLDNGLTVILHRDPSLPLVAVNLWYHVGPANETPGRSGFAHLFEHLMFEGTRHVGREFDRLLEAAGATNVNGTTGFDRTNYFETVPRENLELALWIESDRMGYLLDVLDQERLDVQREVVKNERRQSYDNAPYGPSWLVLVNTLFPAGHPYHGAVIGSMDDLSRATLADVQKFFREYYNPGNASLALAGDFEVAPVKRLIDKYFGALRGSRRARTSYTATPALVGPRRVEIVEPVELARVSMGYIAPPAFSSSSAALHVAMAILAGGKATRLYRSLVLNDGLASQVSATIDANGMASIVELAALVASGKSVAAVETALEANVADLAEKGPGVRELARAKRRLLLDFHSDLELLNGPGGESGRAGLLQRFDHYLGDPAKLDDWVQRIRAVSSADIQRAVAKQLRPQARVTVVTVPRQAGE